MTRVRVVGGALLALAVPVAYRLVVRPWHERWGATEEEVDTQLPGDDLIAEPAAQITRGITIDAPTEAVWPWVIQIGADRGGFYSYDRLENLFGLDIHSAGEIVPEWQRRAVGDLMYADAKTSGGWYAMDVRPDEALVVKMANLKEAVRFAGTSLRSWSSPGPSCCGRPPTDRPGCSSASGSASATGWRGS